jgi:hypothetical protein
VSHPDLAQLELELRQLRGVLLVAFSERGHETVVELTVEEGMASDHLRAEADRLAESEIERSVVVEVIEATTWAEEVHTGSRLRVQLVAVAPQGGDDVLEVHLAYRGRRAVSSCRIGDRVAVAEAVLEGLGKLGLPVPFEPAAVHLLAGDLGNGALVLLRHQRLGALRRGMAGGRRVEEAIARAVLNGLNRYLEDGSGGGEQDHIGPGLPLSLA